MDILTAEGEFLVLLGPSGCGKTTLLSIIALVQERMKKLTDYIPLTKFLFAEEVNPSVDDLIPKKSNMDEARQMLAKSQDALGSVPEWNAATLEQKGRALADEMSVKPAKLFMCLRVALTGTRVSPPLFESMELLGRERTLARIDAARAKLESSRTESEARAAGYNRSAGDCV